MPVAKNCPKLHLNFAQTLKIRPNGEISPDMVTLLAMLKACFKHYQQLQLGTGYLPKNSLSNKVKQQSYYSIFAPMIHLQAIIGVAVAQR